MEAKIRLTLLSDATFGRGDGVAGLLDQEIEHDPETGLPFLRGRTLKGLLVESCADILYTIDPAYKIPAAVTLPTRLNHHTETYALLKASAHFLFGRPGSLHTDDAQMQVSAAQLPKQLREAVAFAVKRKKGDPYHLRPMAVLDSLTAIRQQTSVDQARGVPQAGSLRTMRVLLRETELIAELDFRQEPSLIEWALLAACVRGVRRGGTGRNRGRGRLDATLLTPNANWQLFKQLVGAA